MKENLEVFHNKKRNRIILVSTIAITFILVGIIMSLLIRRDNIRLQGEQEQRNAEKIAFEDELQEEYKEHLESTPETTTEYFYNHLNEKGYTAYKEGNNKYYIIKNGINYEIHVEKDTVYIEEIGTIQIPRIAKVILTVTKDSISLNNYIIMLNEGKLTYSYKKSSDNDYIVSLENTTNKEHTIANLEIGKEYDIKIEAINENGKSVREILKVKLVDDGETVIIIEDGKEENEDNEENEGSPDEDIPIIGTIEITSISWNEQKARVKITTNEERYVLQYQVGNVNENWQEIANGDFTGYEISTGETIYARLTDGKKESEITSLVINDTINPFISDVSPSIEEAEISAIDNESGIIGYAITESEETPESWIEVSPTESMKLNVTGLLSGNRYYAWVKDMAGNTDIKEFSTTIMQIPIYNKDQLSKIGSNQTIEIEQENNDSYKFSSDANYIIKNDVDLAGINWTPLPSFSGNLEGNNKTISNLTMNTTLTNAGFFMSNNGNISNLRLENVNINNSDPSSSTTCVGGIAGKTSYNSIIKNCYVTGNISNVKNLSGKSYGLNYVGGLVGSASGGYITNCYNAASVSDNQEGSNNISGSGARYNAIGGIVGETSSVIISDCFNIGEVIGINNVTSISGGGSTAVYAGGLVGYHTSSQIINSYNTGKVSVNKDSNLGGIVGWCMSSSLTNCYWYKGSSNATKAIGSDIASSKTNVLELSGSDIENQTSFIGFDFENIWTIENGITSPYLKNLPKPF